MTAKAMRNIGPRTAAWLRQVGLRTREDLQAVGAALAYAKVRRAGFKPSLNVLYSLEGALLDCHWQDVPLSRRQQLQAEAQAIIAGHPGQHANTVAGPVIASYAHADDAQDDSPDSERCG